jgi:hypothetical protein
MPFSLRLSTLLLVSTLASAAWAQAPAMPAEKPVMLSPEDVFFSYRLLDKGHRMCGFKILGNHFSNNTVPRSEWELNVFEIVSGKTRVAGISAGAFEVVGKDKKAPREPRPPIVGLSFSVNGDATPINAAIVGTPGVANAIRAVLDDEPAQRLFAAFYEPKLITIALRYQDGTSDLLQVRNWRDEGKFADPKNNYFVQCMRGDRPERQWGEVLR